VGWDGREWLTAAGTAVNGHYGDRKIVAAIKKQAATFIHGQPYHNEPALPSGCAARFPSKVLFTNSGIEAWDAP
jgi:glutamate-1-semialdehyde aminotransferase